MRKKGGIINAAPSCATCPDFLKWTQNIIDPAVGKEQTAKGGVLYEVGCSADGYKPVIGHVVVDRMGIRGKKQLVLLVR